MIRIHTFTFNPFSENTYVIADEATRECVIVDPGCMSRQEQAELAAWLKAESLNPVKLLNTHCHIDHIFGNRWVKEKYQIPLLTNEKDLLNLHGSVQYAELVGLPFDPSPLPDQYLDEGDVVEFGRIRLEVLFTPGHAPGHLSFLHRESMSLFSGDVLFMGSIGRTDLPGGNYKTLMKSIAGKLLPLPDAVKVYSGHGPVTTIGAERNSNPFILDYLQEHV